MRRMLGELLIPLGIAYGAVLVLVFLFQSHLVFFPGTGREAVATPQSYGLRYEHLKIRTADDETLDAWWVPAENARGAAFRDPRFPALRALEWPQCRVEVSLLGAPTPISFSDEADLVRSIRPGEDGLILEADGRRATFLPQVWQSVPDTRVFLGELLRKAGLPADTALARCTISRYRVIKFDGR